MSNICCREGFASPSILSVEIHSIRTTYGERYWDRRFKSFTRRDIRQKYLTFKSEVFLSLCVGKDLNLRSPKATDLQSVVIDHSTTDAYIYLTLTVMILAHNYPFFYRPEIILVSLSNASFGT